MAKNEPITRTQVIGHARASRTELAWCATALRQAAQELDSSAESLATAGPEEIRLTAIRMNSAAVRAVFSILTTRGLGERLALSAALLGEEGPR